MTTLKSTFVLTALAALLAGASAFSQDTLDPEAELTPPQTADNPMGDTPLHYQSRTRRGATARLTQSGTAVPGCSFTLALWIDRAQLSPGLTRRTFLTLKRETEEDPHWVELASGFVSVDLEAYDKGMSVLEVERESYRLSVSGSVAREAMDEGFECSSFKALENIDVFLPETKLKNPAGHVVGEAGPTASGRLLRAATDKSRAMVHVVVQDIQAVGEVKSVSEEPLGLGLGGRERCGERRRRYELVLRAHRRQALRRAWR